MTVSMPKGDTLSITLTVSKNGVPLDISGATGLARAVNGSTVVDGIVDLTTSGATGVAIATFDGTLEILGQWKVQVRIVTDEGTGTGVDELVQITQSLWP